MQDCVTFDIDPTDVTTHGQQQLTMFHGYYDQYQYFPQIITESPTQHTFFAQLRHGSMHPARGADECLLAVTRPLRKQRLGIAINVRAETSMCTRLTCGVSLPIGTGYSETRELARKVLVCRDRQPG